MLNTVQCNNNNNNNNNQPDSVKKNFSLNDQIIKYTIFISFEHS
jgi:hypothetical protein